MWNPGVSFVKQPPSNHILLYRSLLLEGNIFAQEDALTREGQGGRARAVLVGLGVGYDLSW